MRLSPSVALSCNLSGGGIFPQTPFWGDTPRRKNRAAPPDLVFYLSLSQPEVLEVSNRSEKFKKNILPDLPERFCNF